MSYYGIIIFRHVVCSEYRPHVPWMAATRERRRTVYKLMRVCKATVLYRKYIQRWWLRESTGKIARSICSVSTFERVGPVLVVCNEYSLNQHSMTHIHMIIIIPRAQRFVVCGRPLLQKDFQCNCIQIADRSIEIRTTDDDVGTRPKTNHTIPAQCESQ